MRLTYEQRGRKGKVKVRLEEEPGLELVTFETAGRDVTAEVREFRKSWLGSKALE